MEERGIAEPFLTCLPSHCPDVGLRQMSCPLCCVRVWAGWNFFSPSAEDLYFFLSVSCTNQPWCVILQVKLTVFWQYMKAVSPVISLIICFLYCCQNAASIGANVWLSDWTNEPVINGTQHNTSMRIGVYAALGLLQGGTR